MRGTRWPLCQMDCWSSTGSLDCSLDRSSARSVNGSVARSFDRSVARSLDPLMARSIGRSIARSLDRSIGRLIARSIDWWPDRSTARLLDRSIARSLDRSIAGSLDCSIARSFEYDNSIAVHVSWPTGLMFDAIQVGGSRVRILAPQFGTFAMGSTLAFPSLPPRYKKVTYGGSLEYNADPDRRLAGTWYRNESQISGHQLDFMFNFQSTRLSSTPRGSGDLWGEITVDVQIFPG